MSEDKSSSNETGSGASGSVPPSSQEPSQQGVFSLSKPKRSQKWMVIAAIVLGLLLVGGGIWWWLSLQSSINKNEETASDHPVLSNVCDTAVVKSAGKPIADNDLVGLQTIADDIVQKKDYRGDVNCNYILMRYYLMIGDTSKAKSTMNDLSYTHGNSGGYSTVFDPPAQSPAVLRETLEVMISNNQEEQKQNDELNGLDP